MTESDRIFLTVAESLAAIRIDFRHYPPQTGLFIDLAPRILGPEIRVVRTPRSHDLFLTSGGHSMAAISPEALGDQETKSLERELTVVTRG